jgi:hypothetical protein
MPPLKAFRNLLSRFQIAENDHQQIVEVVAMPPLSWPTASMR